jgi:hypothetical protein
VSFLVSFLAYDLTLEPLDASLLISIDVLIKICTAILFHKALRHRSTLS